MTRKVRDMRLVVRYMDRGTEVNRTVIPTGIERARTKGGGMDWFLNCVDVATMEPFDVNLTDGTSIVGLDSE